MISNCNSTLILSPAANLMENLKLTLKHTAITSLVMRSGVGCVFVTHFLLKDFTQSSPRWFITFSQLKKCKYD